MKRVFLITVLIAMILIAGCGKGADLAAAAQTGGGTERQGTVDIGIVSDDYERNSENTLQQSTDTGSAGGQQPDIDVQAPDEISAQIPAGIKDYLVNNAQKLVIEYRPDTPGLSEPIKISDTCSILDYAAGNLDSDGYDELAVIVENSGESDEDTGSASRWLLILSRRGQEKYSIVNYNPGFVLGAEEGGMFGDPYSGISINDNILSVVHYGGSNYRWGYVHEFAYEGGRLELIRLTENDEFTGTGNGTRTVYDFKDTSLKQYAVYSDGSTEKLIYDCPISKHGFLFDNFRIEDLNYEEFSARYLPNLDAYDYYNGTLIKTNTSPDKVLDSIMESRFPDFKKVEFSWTEETRKNYASVCFFEPAGYYYEKGYTTLYYWKAEADDSGSVRHIVLLNSSDPAGEPKCDFYYYNDKTGEINKM